MKKVLIIDDEKDFCYFIKQNLELTNDFNVCVCDDSRFGIKMAKDFRPGIIILDIVMPHITGSELAADLRDDIETRDIPIIFLTAMVRKNEIRCSGDFIGGNYFIAKPVKIEELIVKINQFVEGVSPK